MGTTPPSLRVSPLISWTYISKRGLLASSRNSALLERTASPSARSSLRE